MVAPRRTRAGPVSRRAEGIAPSTARAPARSSGREARRRGAVFPILFLSSRSPWSWGEATLRRLTSELRVALLVHKPLVASLVGEQVEYALELAAPHPPSTDLSAFERAVALLRQQY